VSEIQNARMKTIINSLLEILVALLLISYANEHVIPDILIAMGKVKMKQYIPLVTFWKMFLRKTF
jgi:hypothetical protein